MARLGVSKVSRAMKNAKARNVKIRGINPVGNNSPNAPKTTAYKGGAGATHKHPSGYHRGT